MQNYGQPAGGADPNAILNECREVDRALDQLDEQLNDLERVFRQVLARPDMPSNEINNLSTQIMTGYRGLVSRVRNIKSKQESGTKKNAPQVGKVDRRLKTVINRYQTLEADFRRDSQAAAERQYRIVRPDATEEEVREAVADPDAPIFQQAVCFSPLFPRLSRANNVRSFSTPTAAAKPRQLSATSRSATKPSRTLSARWLSSPSCTRTSTRLSSSKSPL
jgi:syntaxin 1B/2/3